MVDERDLIEFETEYVVADPFPDRIDRSDLLKCSACGAESKPLPATEVTVIKHRHGSPPLGHLRLHFHTHLAAAKLEWGSSGGGSQRMGAICPNCRVAVPVGTGECDTCGRTVLA